MKPLAPSRTSVQSLLADTYAPQKAKSRWYCDDEFCDGKPHKGWEWKHCRANQRPPGNDWFIWLLLSGRGFGKSRCAAEWLVDQASQAPKTEWGVIGPTTEAVRKCGEDLTAGIYAIAPPGLITKYNRSLGDFYLSNGAVIHLISADKPDRLRGFTLAGAWCVATGEMVTTERGAVPIEDVRRGDRVATRTGWRTVTRHGRTGTDRAILQIVTEDGRSLRCTPDHLVFANGTWCEARCLMPGDTLATWMDPSSTAHPHGASGKDSVGGTTPRCVGTGGLRGSSWPSPCGAGTTGLFRTATKFITKMKTQQMTAWKTWRPSRSMSTAHTTVQKTGPKVQLLRRSPVDLGQPLCGPIVSSRHGFVSSAGMHIKRAQPIPAIAASNVVCGHATVASVSASGCSDVYDITVDGAHEFFANGILVHNCDELSSWRYPDTWYLGLLPTLRDPRTTPHVVVTSTPKPVQLLRSLVDEEMSEHGTTVVTRGSTFDNAANLAPQFLDEMRNRYEGTRRGRQELYGELLTDVDGALVNIDMIDNTRLREFPDIRMVRIVVAVDPATTSGEDSDETGIVVVARGSDGRGYVLDDLSCKETPDGWARIVAHAYDKYGADRVVAEKNQGGDMVETIVRSVHPNIAYKSISAKVGKKLRAEPIAALYEQGKVSHVGYFPQLEDQWTTWVPDQRGQRSPDRVDALVHGLTELGLVGASTNNFREWMESEHPPCVACGTPAPRGTPTCSKCGADRADPGTTEPEPVPDPWSLSSRPTNRVVPNQHTQAVMEALKVYAPRTFGPFGPFGSFDR